MKVTVVGAGTMGNGIAQVFATSGHQVVMVDVSAAALERGLGSINASLGRLVKKGALTQEASDQAAGRIAVATTVEDARNAELAVEAATENPALKFQIFEQLDRACPAATILATNTSSISITEIAAKTKRPELVIGMHFMNPVPVMQLVEVIRGQATSDATTRTCHGSGQRAWQDTGRGE